MENWTGNLVFSKLGCIELDLILAPISNDENDVKAAIHDLRPKLILYISEFSSRKNNISTKVEILLIDDFMKENHVIKDKGFYSPILNCNLKELPALLIKTSGTTGQPKYVELSEKNLAWNCYSLQKRFACDREDRFLCTLPWSHMNAIMLTGCLPLIAGATVVYCNITYYQNPISVILDTKASIISLTPTLILFLMRRKTPEQNLRVLKFIFCGAAPLSASIWRAGEKALKCNIHQGYGLTETTCWMASTIPGEKKDYFSVGKPLTGEINIGKICEIENQNKLSEISTHKFGEINVKGPFLMCGYRYPNGRRSIKLTNDGCFNTGDIGYIDKNGNLKIIGRSKDIIIRSGINIVPESIDAILRTHPSIMESKTVGLPDEFLGERVVTAYIPRTDSNINDIELRRFIANTLPEKSLPNDFMRVAQFSIVGVGKVAIGELRKIVGGDYARKVFESINTWKFKRAHPGEPERIIQAFQKKILMSQPLMFISYWGIGLKKSISDSDKKAMHRLKEFVDASTLHSKLKVSLKFILTDIHALLNGKPQNRINHYLGEIEELCKSYGFLSVRSSELWKKSGLNITDILTQDKLMNLTEVVKELNISSDLISRLFNSAEKHVEWGAANDGLKRYLLACKSERDMIATEYNDSVFLTYNDPEMGFLSPPLPIISLSSYHRGTAIKPWFVEE